MVDLSLAHNSPQPDENEQSQGIFTNYMQFMDNMVGKWMIPALTKKYFSLCLIRKKLVRRIIPSVINE
jgi:hypothetical protein